MMRNNLLKIVLVFVLVSSFLITLAPKAIALASNLGGLVVEEFTLPIQYKQPGVASNYYWWAIMNQNSLQYFGSPCDPLNVVCITRLNQNGEKFARLSVAHDSSATVGYNNADFAELQTGVSYHKGLERWSPTVGHPVVFTQTMRFGPNYNQDGSGGAVGSAGGGLWNSYPDGFPSHPVLQPITAFWWGWAEQGTAFGQLDSLSVSVFNENNLVYFQKVPVTLNMHDWMTWVETWSALPNGNQRVKFTVLQNGHLYVVGDTNDFYPTGIAPLSPLSEESWNDNQFVNDFDQNGNPIVVFHNPSSGSVDYWDMNGMTISQP